MTFIRCFIFNVLYTAWAMISSLIFAPLFFISREASLRSGAPWAKFTLLMARLILGITYEVRGKQYITNEPVIYASKHQSAWDTMIFLVLLKRPCYVLKRSLLRIPLWGWYLWRMGMIAIDRDGSTATMKQMLRDGKERIAEGRTIVIFPEGTRMKPGSAPQYHPGIIALYKQLDVPVVPVALNSGVYWGKDAFFKKPGKIIISFLPPIPAGLKKGEFSNQLQLAIETESNQLLEQQ